MQLLLSSIKQFRPTIISIILLVLASVRMFVSGNSIMVVGVCASVVPFICQFKRYPNKNESVPELKKVLANYFMNLIFMAVYLCFMTGITFLGSALLPSYTVNPYYGEMMAMSICANVIFISCIYTVGHRLTPKQLLMEGILLCNGQLGFMMLASDYVKKAGSKNLVAYSIGFSVLIFLLTMAFVKMNYGSKLNESQ